MNENKIQWKTLMNETEIDERKKTDERKKNWWTKKKTDEQKKQMNARQDIETKHINEKTDERK